MVKGDGNQSKDTTPSAFPETTPPTSDMPAYSAQVLFEMNHTLGRIEGTLNSLNKQVESVDSRLGAVERHWNWIAGGITVAIVLIPICAGIVWYSLGERIQHALQIIPPS